MEKEEGTARLHESPKLTSKYASFMMNSRSGSSIMRHIAAFEEELVYLEKPFSEVGLWYYVVKYLKVMALGVFMSTDYIGENLISTMGFYLCNQTGSEIVSASFGNALFMASLFLLSFMTTIAEKTTMTCALAFGQKKFKACKRYFIKGVFTQLMYFSLVIIPLAIFAEKFIDMYGLEEGVRTLCSRYFRKMLVINMTFSASEILRGYIAAQGHEDIVIMLAFGNLASSICLFGYFCWYLNYGLDGWFLANTLQKVFQVVSILITSYFKVDKRTRNGFTWEDLTEGYWQYFKETVEYTVGALCEEVVFQLSTLLVNLTQDASQIAAQTAIINTISYIYETSPGFTLVARLRFGILLGRKKVQAAKRLFHSVFIGMFCTALLVGLLLVTFTDELSSVYSSNNEEVDSYVRPLIVEVCIFIGPIFTLTYLNTICRCIGWFTVLAYANVSFMIVLQMVFGLVILYGLHGDVTYLSVNTFALMSILAVFVYTRISCADWSHFSLMAEDEEAMQRLLMNSKVEVDLEPDTPHPALQTEHNELDENLQTTPPRVMALPYSEISPNHADSEASITHIHKNSDSFEK